jgi:asparagine synthetase B (glutamine-hydrolysing)
MCGIFGWIKPTAKTSCDLDLAEIFRKGMVETQVRGEDASGFYTTKHGLVKAAIPADEWVDDNVPDDIAKERFIIGHCRMASAKYDDKNISDPRNAQPFESTNWVSVHNGTISTPRIKNYKFTSDIDSESIIALAEKVSLRNALQNVDADSAIVMHNKKTRKLFFWTHGDRPLALAFYQGMIFFASTKKILRNTLAVEDDFQIFPRISFAIIYEDELLEFDLNNNKFFRRGLVAYKPPVQKVTSSTMVSSVMKPLGITHNRPAVGCVQNPKPPEPRQHVTLISDDYCRPTYRITQ